MVTVAHFMHVEKAPIVSLVVLDDYRRRSRSRERYSPDYYRDHRYIAVHTCISVCMLIVGWVEWLGCLPSQIMQT